MRTLPCLSVLALTVVFACDEKKPAPSPAPSASTAPSASAVPSASVAEPKKETDWQTSPVDPAHGKFTLEEATAGLTGSGKLLADVDTIAGKLTCELFEDKAPMTVANFVGLARGLRPWKGPEGKWVKQPAFDNNEFHRVVKKFMIQGGSPPPACNGNGGYFFADEIWPGAAHDHAGLLCMANSGANTNSMQFFILDDKADYLDERQKTYTIFGDCKPTSVVRKIASAKTQREKPTVPQTIKKVTIRREKK
jgi:peptidyl-prolyl cis-trans isomerase A (cyclophilin A)